MTPLDFSDGGAHLRIRDGRKVVIYCTDAPGKFPIHGRITNEYCPFAWNIDGLCSNGRYSMALIPAPPEPITVYVNVYPNPLRGAGHYNLSEAGPDKAELLRNVEPHCIAIAVPLTFTPEVE